MAIAGVGLEDSASLTSIIGESTPHLHGWCARGGSDLTWV